MTTQHTPTPWRATPFGSVQSVGAAVKTIADMHGHWSGTTAQINADAAHIALCVNSHDELIAALRPFIEIWAKGGPDYAERMATYWDYDRLNAARAALSRAGV